MKLKMFRFLIHFVFLCLIVTDNVPIQASQEGQSTLEQSSSYFFYQRPEYPRDCKEIQQQCSSQNSSRTNFIQPDGLMEPFLAYCEDEWTIIQRRVDGFINFNRDWTDYKDGFGFLNADFWIGNEKLAYLTNQKQYELMISFETETGDSYHVTYNMFRIGDAFSDFRLISVGEFTGMLGNLETSRPPIDCYDIQLEGSTTSGDYTVNPNGWFDGPFTINCNMDIDGGGWTVFQRKSGGSQPFNLNWDSYKEGFGTLTGEFWMGNDKLAFITDQKEYEIRIDLTNDAGLQRYVHHDFFRIADESDNYRMVGLGNYSGTAAFDALTYHRYMGFSTIDRDNDPDPAAHCGFDLNGGWWYYSCSNCDLNRPNPFWRYFVYPGSVTITYSEMKIRPLDRTVRQ